MAMADVYKAFDAAQGVTFFRSGGQRGGIIQARNPRAEGHDILPPLACGADESGQYYSA